MLALYVITGLYAGMIFVTLLLLADFNKIQKYVYEENGIHILWALVWPVVWYRIIKNG